jgi:hypothetical protein
MECICVQIFSNQSTDLKKNQKQAMPAANRRMVSMSCGLVVKK